jgi:hypothetical protein
VEVVAMKVNARSWGMAAIAALSFGWGGLRALPQAEAAGTVGGPPSTPTPPALRYLTFEVRPIAVTTEGAMKPDPLGARIAASLEDRLRSRGLRAEQNDPDVIVMYAVSGRNTSSAERLAGLKPLEGSVTIQLYDPDAKRVVWESSARAGEGQLDDLVKTLLDRALVTTPVPA